MGEKAPKISVKRAKYIKTNTTKISAAIKKYILLKRKKKRFDILMSSSVVKKIGAHRVQLELSNKWGMKWKTRFIFGISTLMVKK